MTLGVIYKYNCNTALKKKAPKQFKGPHRFYSGFNISVLAEG